MRQISTVHAVLWFVIGYFGGLLTAIVNSLRMDWRERRRRRRLQFQHRPLPFK